MASLSHKLREALAREGPDAWDGLTKRLIVYAICLLRGRRWRCVVNGVPPEGFSAETIVNQAFEEFFAGSGWEPKGDPYTNLELEYELKRLVLNLVRRLERRKENISTSNEPDLKYESEELSEESFFNNYPGDFTTPTTELERLEAKAALRQFQVEFIAFLGMDQLPRQIFDCICEGTIKRDEQAKRLGVTPQEITNARKRLHRSLDRFAEQHAHFPGELIQAIKDV